MRLTEDEHEAVRQVFLRGERERADRHWWRMLQGVIIAVIIAGGAIIFLLAGWVRVLWRSVRWTP